MGIISKYFEDVRYMWDEAKWLLSTCGIILLLMAVIFIPIIGIGIAIKHGEMLGLLGLLALFLVPVVNRILDDD